MSWNKFMLIAGLMFELIDGTNNQAYAVDRFGHRTPVYPVGNGRYTDGNGHELYPP